MTRLLYNLLFPFVLLFLLPGFLYRMVRRGKYRHKFWQRFGIYSVRVRARLAARQWTWMHAVSVGEVLVALKLMEKMKEHDPGLNLVLSTTTSTGFALAREKTGDWVEVIYNPIDFLFTVRRALDVIRPRRLILVEAEVWPNVTAEAKKRGVPVALVNARLSPRSEGRFRRFRALTAQVFRALDLICVQEPEDVARWTSLGPDESRIRCVGSIKYDYESVPRPGRDFAALLTQAGLPPSAQVLLGGSTHAGEEVILGHIYRELKQRFPDFFLIIVPRHVERTGEIVPALRQLGLTVALRTGLESIQLPPGTDCLLVNTTGELRDWYYAATIVFIGKSLAAKGGQNPAEAVIAGKPVIFGPYMENFSAIVRMLLAHKAAVQVADESALGAAITNLLSDPALRKKIGGNAEAVLAPHRGATERTVGLLAHL